MNEIERLLEQLDRSWSGDAWHGPPLTEVLAGFGPEVAAARPVAGAHTIWELALHMKTWQEVAARRLEGEEFVPGDEANFPSPPEATEVAWDDTVRGLEAARERLRSAAAALSPEVLDTPTPGTHWSAYNLVHGIIQHDLYHAGQMVVLARAASGVGSSG